MLTLQEKRKMWRRVCRDFPGDAMMQEVHLIREVMSALEKKGEGRNYRELSVLTRRECAELLKHVTPARRSRETATVGGKQ